MTEPNDPYAVEVQHLWKIFGDRPDEARRAYLEDGLGKEEIRRKLDCVIGVIDATFQVRKAEIFCIMGLSGSGKSTLVRHINRLIEPTFGRVLIGGEDINALGERELRQARAEKIGMVFQNIALLPHRTVRDNVAISLEFRGVPAVERWRIAEEALQLVQLGGWGDTQPSKLSGGMQQRVGLARALAADPHILLMDEPFSALDPVIRRQLQDQFLMLAAKMKKTTIFITHDLEEAIRIGSRIAIMKDGAIVQIGTPEDIVLNPKDDYVREFIQGISKLKLVKARAIMRPIGQERERSAVDDPSAPSARPDDDLNALIALTAKSARPILIKDDGKVVGIIEPENLLRGFQGAAA